MSLCVWARLWKNYSPERALPNLVRALEMCTEMGMAGTPWNPRETRRDGDKVLKSCGNPAGMKVSLAGGSCGDGKNHAGVPRSRKGIVPRNFNYCPSLPVNGINHRILSIYYLTLTVTVSWLWCQYHASFVCAHYVHFNILLLSCQCARGWGWKKCTAGMGEDGDEMP